MSEPAHGATLLRVIPAAFHLMIPLLFGPLMLLGGILLTLGAPKSRGTGIVMLLVGLGVTAMGIRGTRRRTLLIEVTERGIMIYANADGICVSYSMRRNLFIPWERLKSMRFLTPKQISAGRLWVAAGSPLGTPGCVVLRLRMDWSWPPLGTLRNGITTRRGKPGEIYLDSMQCSPSGMKLWGQLAPLVAKYGGPDVAIDMTSGTGKKGWQSKVN
jgi:hypothetical protein